MQISSLIDILDGKLLNTPSISFIYAIKTNPKKVKEGDLFLAKNIVDIPQAVKNGAFAIVFKDKFDIIDDEIAWIKVEDTNIALIKLVRYKLSTVNIKAYYCKQDIYDLLQIYSPLSKKHIILTPNKLDNFLQDIDDISSNEDILISSNKELLDSLYPKNSCFEDLFINYEIKNLLEHSLFESSFSYKEFYFQKLKIPSIYIDSYLRICNFLDEIVDTNKLKYFYNFKPVFLDKNINVIEFGKSDRFLLCQNNNSLIKDEIKFLKSHYKYAKILYISKTDMQFIQEDNLLIFENLNKLKSTLKKADFNAVYLMGFEYQEIIENLKKIEHQATLF